jgi:hypothetical protein
VSSGVRVLYLTHSCVRYRTRTPDDTSNVSDTELVHRTTHRMCQIQNSYTGRHIECVRYRTLTPDDTSNGVVRCTSSVSDTFDVSSGVRVLYLTHSMCCPVYEFCRMCQIQNSYTGRHIECVRYRTRTPDGTSNVSDTELVHRTTHRMCQIQNSYTGMCRPVYEFCI